MSKGILFFCILFFIVGCSTHQQNGAYSTYYENGALKSVQSLKNNVLNGISRQYYDSGTLKHAINYKNDEIDGMYNTYYPNGALWVNEIYSEGNVISRKEYNESGELIKSEDFYVK